MNTNDLTFYERTGFFKDLHGLLPDGWQEHDCIQVIVGGEILVEEDVFRDGPMSQCLINALDIAIGNGDFELHLVDVFKDAVVYIFSKHNDGPPLTYNRKIPSKKKGRKR